MVRAKRATTGIRNALDSDRGSGRGECHAAWYLIRDPARVDSRATWNRWSLASLGPPATLRASSGGVVLELALA